MKAVESIMSRVEIDPNSGCWLWSGSIDQGGYGRVRYGGKARSVHRLMFSLLKGPLGDKNVLHRCDTPPCCNPDHLWLGTQAENVADMYKKGRANRPSLRGDRSNNRKMTSQDVVVVRRMRSEGATWKAISEAVGVSTRAVRHASAGTRWSDVKTPYDDLQLAPFRGKRETKTGRTCQWSVGLAKRRERSSALHIPQEKTQ